MLHPPHHQEVDKRSHHPISNIVFRFPKLPLMVCNGNLNDSIASHFDESREEPVHPIKHPDLLHAFPFESPQGAGAVMNIFSAQSVSNRIANS
jgi:hypothetical protein